MDRVRIATRKSRLAMWQAESIKAELQRAHRGLDVQLVALATAGDRWLEAPLGAVGGKGLFINELEAALARGDADLAVHSMKDMPALLAPEFALPVVAHRQDARDAWISPQGGLDATPAGAKVGTSSLRRQAQLLSVRPDLDFRPIRGNLDTRLRKLDAGEYDAIVLAMAGLIRLGWTARVTEALATSRCLPAAGQGALGVECRADDQGALALLAPLQDPTTMACVSAERGVSIALDADCAMPLAAHAQRHAGLLTLRALLASPDGKRLLKAQAAGRAETQVVNAVVEDLQAQGAMDLLRELRGAGQPAR